MDIQQPQGRTHTLNRNANNAVNQHDQTHARQNWGNNQPPAFSQNLLLLLLSLILQLLQQLQGNSNQPQPQPDPEPLALSPTQQNNLRELLGFTANAPIGVQILDQDGDGQISVGDTATASGGISGGAITEKPLTAEDITAINQTGNLPADFQENRQKWEQATANSNSISYTTQQTCFCPQEFTRPMTVTEQNGQITNAVYADTGEAVPTNVVNSLLTVDERFDQLQQAYENNAERISVEYNSDTGFPASVFIDQSFQIADEEINYSINNININ